MTGIGPATKFNDLVAALNALPSGTRLNVFEARPYRVEAEKLKRNRPDQAYSLLGMIACLERNINEMRKCHEAAIKVDHDRGYSHESYSISLNRLGFVDEAICHLRIAVDIAPTNPVYLERLIDCCLRIGRVREASRWLAALQKLGREASKQEAVATLLPLFDAAGFADDEVARVVGRAFELAIASEIPVDTAIPDLLLDPDEATRSYCHRMFVKASPLQVAELNVAMAELRATMDGPKSITAGLTVTFRIAKSESDVDRAA